MTIWGSFGTKLLLTSKKFKIARNRPFKVARIGVLHYKWGLAEAKKSRKRPKIAPRVNFNHLGVIWDKVATSEKFKIARYRAFKVARISVLHYKWGLAEAKKGRKKAKIGKKSPPE